MDSTHLFEQLAAPMPSKWRLKQVANKAKKPYPDGARGSFLAYIDARDVFNRLDAVVGLANWQSAVKRINEDGSALVSLSLRVEGEWIVREDVGYPNTPGAGVEEEPLKGAVSDAIKRAGVHFGVGRFLYDMPPVWVEIDQNGHPLAPIGGSPAPVRPAPAPSDALAPQSAGAELDNQPCAVEGCAGVCLGSWVGFSVRRYGVTLCPKHSAQAKRGDLEGILPTLAAR